MYPQRTRHRPPWLEVDGLFHMGPQCMTEYKRKENSAVLLEFFSRSRLYFFQHVLIKRGGNLTKLNLHIVIMMYSAKTSM